MISNGVRKESVLIVGEGKLAYSVTVCFLQSGYAVSLCTQNKEEAVESINIHFADLTENGCHKISRPLLEVTDALDGKLNYPLVIAVTEEDLLKKRSLIQELERKLSLSAAIGINSESIPLSVLQEGCKNPDRIIGLNWSEPAHTTYFLEIISNSKSNSTLVDQVFQEAKTNWSKDPYVISRDLGIRARMLAAMTREAFYLVENGFASIEDIDRACRNDPGYYLPFAGNFRYIDLMGGASGFGRVMKALNPELSKAQKMPGFFTDFIEKGEQFMDNNNGIYDYSPGEAEEWKKNFRKYSYQIQAIIGKYPFKYKKELSPEQKGIKY